MKVATKKPTFNARKGSGKKVHFFNHGYQWCASGTFNVSMKQERFDVYPTPSPVTCEKCLAAIEFRLDKIGMDFIHWIIANPVTIQQCASPVSWTQALHNDRKLIARDDYAGLNILGSIYQEYYKSYFYALIINAPESAWRFILEREMLINGDSGFWVIED